jgi:hypothetical protein
MLNILALLASRRRHEAVMAEAYRDKDTARWRSNESRVKWIDDVLCTQTFPTLFGLMLPRGRA